MPSLAWSGLAWLLPVQFGTLWYGLVWAGVGCSGLVWSGPVRYGLLWSDLACAGCQQDQLGLALAFLVWSCHVWSGLENPPWFGLVWSGLILSVWSGLVQLASGVCSSVGPACSGLGGPGQKHPQDRAGKKRCILIPKAKQNHSKGNPNADRDHPKDIQRT